MQAMSDNGDAGPGAASHIAWLAATPPRILTFFSKLLAGMYALFKHSGA